MNKTTAKKYLTAIESSKRKYLTCELLSHSLGIYPEIIAENLSFFEPTLAMDPSFNLKDLIPALNAYIEEESKKAPKKHRIIVNKDNVEQYEGVADFIYQKMTIGGLVDKNAELSTVDLKILKKLIQAELDEKKKN